MKVGVVSRDGDHVFPYLLAKEGGGGCPRGKKRKLIAGEGPVRRFIEGEKEGRPEAAKVGKKTYCVREILLRTIQTLNRQSRTGGKRLNVFRRRD